MIRRKVSLVSLLLFLLPLAMSGITLEVHAQLLPTKSIAVSVSSLAGIVQEVGGSRYNTTVLLEQETDPHAFAVTPDIITTADEADLLVLTGHFHWEEELANLTSTPFITFHDDDGWENYEDYGAELSPMPGGEVEENGDDHEHDGNPHAFWLLPQNALAIANATRAALSTLNVTLSNEWTSNFELFTESVNELEELIYSLDEVYGFSEMHAVVVAPAEAYVAETFGIASDAVLQVEDITISGAKLLEVQQAIRNGTIDLIIGSDVSQFQTGGEFAYQLQADYGGTLIWWRTVFFAELDYFWMMNYNLGALVSGIEGRSGDIADSTVNVGLLALSGVLGALVVIESVLLIIRARAE
ncbi:MAG: metal ABC transporter solute-binding protein, Zn/Mn family [Candidatus Thorarchaeota archaeon]